METPPSPGWYDDPQDENQLRYFDGVIWTAHTAARTTRPRQADSAGQDASAGEPTQPVPTGSSQFPGTPQQQTWNAPGAGGPQAPQQPWGQQGQQGSQWGQPGQQWGQPGQYGQPPAGSYGQYGQQWGVPTTPDGQPLASYLRRVGAFVIDAIITGLLSAVLGGWLLTRAMRPLIDGFWDAVEANDPAAIDRLTSQVDYGALAWFSVLAGVISFAYHVWFLTRSGATPGKALVGISVRLRERPGPLPLGAAAARSSVQTVLGILGNIPLLGFVASLVALLDLLWPLWDDKRQALHDKVGATNVVVGPQPRQR